MTDNNGTHVREVPCNAWSVGLGSSQVTVLWAQKAILVARGNGDAAVHAVPRDAETAKAAIARALSALGADHPDKPVLTALSAKLARSAKGTTE